MMKFVAVAGLVGFMLMGASAPVLAQAGSPNSCQYFQENNPQAYAQFCGAGSREFTEFGSPILGEEDSPEVGCSASLLPAEFPAGDRVHVAESCPR